MLEDLFDDSYVDRKVLEYEDKKLGSGEIGIIGNGKRIRKKYKEDKEKENGKGKQNNES